MGSNRVAVAPVTLPRQTPAPSGSSSLPIPMLAMSSSIKTEPLTHMDATATHCHSENWAESYQDLSSWCSATSASSPAICQSLVTDETLASDVEFHGEIDFDLRKSEEIASIPLEEDCSFNLWSSERQLLADTASPPPPVLADTSTAKPHPVLLKDCWWPEIEQRVVVKELESSRPQAISSFSSLSLKNQLDDNDLSTPTAIKEEVSDTKENMNPLATLQSALLDPTKMAELQMRIDRIAIAQPGVSSKAKPADLLKFLQEQIAFIKKKSSSPAAVSDLHNYSKMSLGLGVPSTSSAESHSHLAQPAATSMAGNAEDIFHSDPFEGLFPGSNGLAQRAQPAASVENPVHQYPQTVTSASPFFVDNQFNSAKPTPQGGSSDLFFEAHESIMKAASKPLQLPNHLQQSPQQFALPQQTCQLISRPAHSASPSLTHFKTNMKSGLTIQLPPRLPDLDINFDALLFGSPGISAGGNKVPAMSTPEVLKPLVETPDPESFDLLSYLCDDKMSTPPVYLDSNPFHFPQLNASQNHPSRSTTVTEHKSNVMVVKPFTPSWTKQENMETRGKGDLSPVIVEVKPQIMPRALSDVGEEMNSAVIKEEENAVHSEEGSTFQVERNIAEPMKEAQVSPRPSRSSRKRKYSEDEFVLSPSPIEEKRKPSRRKKRVSSRYDSDEEFTLPKRKNRKTSITVIAEEEDDDDDDDDEEEEEEEEEGVKLKRPRRASIAKRGERTVSTSSDADRYRELRDRNNEASRKSRLSRKAREQELAYQAETLTKENRVLKVKVEEMENLVKRLREALLQSMMKKSEVSLPKN